MTETRVAGGASIPVVWRVRELVRSHSHRTDEVAAYIVRWTVAPAGGVITDPLSGHTGVDVAFILGGDQYGAAVDAARAYRQGTGYAVVDSCWPCGCRTGGTY